MPKNRVAFMELELMGLAVDELWQLTGFVRCVDCAFLLHTEALATLPGHRCVERQALRRSDS